MAFALPALPFIAMGASALGPIMSGFQQSSANNAQSTYASYNADLARQQAQIAGQVGAEQEADARRKGALFAGSQFASLSEAGGGLEGSASDVMKQSAKFAALDALNKRYEGQVQKTGYLNQANAEDYASQIYKNNAKSSMYGGFLGAGTSILSGVSQYGSVKGWF